MIRITVGNEDVTEHLSEGGFLLRRFGALRSTAELTLYFHQNPTCCPLAGMEITAYENEDFLWGGIVTSVEIDFHETEKATFRIRAQGYEQILNRLCLPGIEYEQTLPSAAVTHIIQNHIPVEDGLTVGTVERGWNSVGDYRFPPARASLVLDALAAENGHLWWVDKHKAFHMSSVLPFAEGLVSIDLTEQDEHRLTDLQTLTYRSSTAGYKNLQYAYNNTKVINGYAVDPTRVLKMKQRYGSGLYGGAMSSSLVASEQEGQAIAAQILQGIGDTDEIEFTTDEDAFRLGQVFPVFIPFCGHTQPESFCVTEIRQVYFYGKFRYTVLAKQTVPGAPLGAKSWEATLAASKRIEVN